jgi:hypothetical protein
LFKSGHTCSILNILAVRRALNRGAD